MFQTTLRVLQESKNSKQPPAIVATKLADELAHEINPIYGHRGEKIIESLNHNKWHEAL